MSAKPEGPPIAAVDTALVFLPSLKVFVPGSSLWGAGVWGGPPGPPIIEEKCRWAPMPDVEGPAKPD